MIIMGWPDTVFGENVIHLFKVGRAVDHHLLLYMNLNGDAGQHTLYKSSPVKTLESKRQQTFLHLGLMSICAFQKQRASQSYIYMQETSALCTSASKIDVYKEATILIHSFTGTPMQIFRESSGTWTSESDLLILWSSSTQKFKGSALSKFKVLMSMRTVGSSQTNTELSCTCVFILLCCA